ncbi:MAG: methionine synthase [bacterium]
MKFAANCKATGIGSVPYTDPAEAVGLVFDCFGKIPFWPQLPNLGFRENMYAQYSRSLPGLCLDKEKVVLNQAEAMEGLEGFYEKFLSEDLDQFKITEEFSQGLPEFLKQENRLKKAAAIKGHITGPISFGLMVTFEDKRAVIYDDNLRDVIIKTLIRQAQWQESIFRGINPHTIIFVDEPYMSSFGSAFINLERDQVIDIFNQVFDEISGLSAVHCCGNTDWGVLIDTNVDIINLDAFDCADMFLLYPDRLKKFLQKGGIVAWGIVPTVTDKITPGAAPELAERMEAIFDRIVAMGVERERILAQSLITPSCGVGSLSVSLAREVFGQTAQVSKLLREKHSLED